MSDEIRLQQERTPMAIESRSMAIIDEEVPEPRPFVDEEWIVARRMIHATADFELLDLIRFHPEAVAAGKAALRAGGVVVTDTAMARAGLPRRRYDALGVEVVSLMDDPRTAARAEAQGVTRAVAGVDLACERWTDLVGVIMVVGNAPTALIRLLECCAHGAKPALILGMPVGFVNAAESKALLMTQAPSPYIAVEGRKGGTAMACAALNALADLVTDGADG